MTARSIPTVDELCLTIDRYAALGSLFAALDNHGRKQLAHAWRGVLERQRQVTPERPVVAALKALLPAALGYRFDDPCHGRLYGDLIAGGFDPDIAADTTRRTLEPGFRC